MKWGVFEHIPLTGSISYKELAEKVGAEEPLISEDDISEIAPKRVR